MTKESIAHIVELIVIPIAVFNLIWVFGLRPVILEIHARLDRIERQSLHPWKDDDGH